MAQSLPDQEGIRSLLDQQHYRRALENVRVLQGLAKPGLPRDLPEQLEHGDPVELDQLL